ncbi:General secretion pathway protein E [hydrothermal vent metagenome]|uniref:protein-secreting ATPase n=1 Tax=hydrothermal vent metagenome TaxID=652676 RepID=A0A3B1AGP1_9ZZZZ
MNADLNQPGLTESDDDLMSGIDDDIDTGIDLTAEGKLSSMVTPNDVNSVNDSFGLPYNFAKRHGVLVKEIRDGIVDIRHRPHISTQTIIELKRYLSGTLELHQLSVDEFDMMLQGKYESQSNDAINMIEGLGDEFDLDSIAEELAEPEDLLESQDDAPIIRLINALLTQAIKEDASDIHIEPFETRMIVRMRVDGVLREVLQPQRALAPLITSRIKIMAKLDIAEKRLPQDGRISLRIAGRSVDVRVSTLPSGHGERIVMRLLDKQAGRLDLFQLGMAMENQVVMDQLIHKPHGIVLVTGPTGSGKTTTLYAGMQRLNDSKFNIMTVEDPIEYYIDGIGQTQVNTKVDMSFARGLRAILRQDPDVVMVGEIRDLETAEIAVQASLTGHLVFSTLHTNTAVGAVTRLRDMGVEPFLLSSSLIGVLAQRLVRKLCEHCKVPRTPDVAEFAVLGLEPSEGIEIYEPIGCDQCNNSGYRGRTGIYELVSIDDTFRTMIHDGSGEHELEHYARTKSQSIRNDGVRRVLAGETTLEEVLRVSRDG